MELFAAIDLAEGSAVRLVRGEHASSRGFGEPLGVAQRFLEAGAPWLHVVDLDAARRGAPENRAVVLALGRAAHAAGARVEVGGGIRTEGDVEELLGAGVDRVVLGTSAIENPSFAVSCARRHPGRVAVGLDYRRAGDGRLVPAVRGWEGAGAGDVSSVIAALRGAPFAAFVVTAIERDGTLEGPDLTGLEAVLDEAGDGEAGDGEAGGGGVAVVASGGVGRAEDLVALAALRSPRLGRALSGVVVGRALVDGTIGVKEAMAACAASA